MATATVLKLMSALLLLLALASVAIFRVYRSPFTVTRLQDVLPQHSATAGIKELAILSDSVDSNQHGFHDKQGHSEGISTTEKHRNPRSLKVDAKEPTNSDNMDSLGHGYVLNLHYPGQQGAGLRTLTVLQCSLGSFDLPMYIVEPYINASKLSVWGNDTSLRMQDYFNIDHFNAVSRKTRYSELATYEDFLEKAPRKVVFLEILWYPIGPRITPIVTWTASDSSSCRNIPEVNNYLKQHGFCVVKTLMVHTNEEHPEMVLTGEELYSYVFGEFKPEEITLIVSTWCTHCFIVNSELQPPDTCEQACEFGLSEKFHPSQKLVALANKYEKIHQGSHKPFGVAAMLRTEHLIREFGTTDQEHAGISACFQELVHVVGDLQKNSPHPRAFMTVDIGKYGSRSWDNQFRIYNYSETGANKLFGAVKNTLQTLTSMTFDEWEDSFSIAKDVIKDSGYIAALQRTIAGRSDCLVLVGGGQFLKLALHDYLNNHPDPETWCVHFVCTEEEYKPLYEEVLENRRSTYNLQSN